jgi:chromosome segregation ATPase
MEHKIVNGIQVPLTAEEISAIQAQEAEWKAGAYDRAMSEIRQKRDSLLKSTDHFALSDNTLSDEMKLYRQALRDITEGVTTLTKAKAVKFPVKP